HRARAMTEGAEIVGREPAGAAEVGGVLLGAHDWVPHFWTVLRSMGGKDRFSKNKPIPITVNRPANTAGISRRLRFSKINQPRPPCPDDTPNTSSAAISVRHANAPPIFK